MTTKRQLLIAVTVLAAAILASGRLRADSGSCGGATATLPFNDVGASIFFCQIAEAYFSGLTNGTSSTTYSPSDAVTRDQMAAFITRTMDQSLKRGSRRAALGQWWTTTPHYDAMLGTTTVNTHPVEIKSDGKDLWVVSVGDPLSFGLGSVGRIHASDGRSVDAWAVHFAAGLLVAMGRVFAANAVGPSLYMIDPSQPGGGSATVVQTDNPIGDGPVSLGFDGARIWTANSSGGSVSIISPAAAFPWNAQTHSTGFVKPTGVLFDGTNIWILDQGDNSIKRVDSNGGVVQSVAVSNIGRAVFDGANIWVPGSNSVTVLRAATGAVLATLTGNGLNTPTAIAFDGQRVLVTSPAAVSLWKATDLTPIGFETLPPLCFGCTSTTRGVCSDGINFWIVIDVALGLAQPGTLARF
jgi:DNA-binding beta-propeller fold protein YncE